MINLAEMCVKELEKELNVYEDLIHGPNQCFGVRDLQLLDAIHIEIEKRGLEFDTTYKLYDSKNEEEDDIAEDVSLRKFDHLHDMGEHND